MFINGVFIGAPIKTSSKPSQPDPRQVQSLKRLKQLMSQINIKRLHEGLLQKQSKHLKHWRERKLILTDTMLGTFKIKSDSNIQATQWIKLMNVQKCYVPAHEKKDPENLFLFNVYGQDKHQYNCNFRFACGSKQERDAWIKQISARLPQNNKPVNKTPNKQIKKDEKMINKVQSTKVLKKQEKTPIKPNNPQKKVQSKMIQTQVSQQAFINPQNIKKEVKKQTIPNKPSNPQK